MAQGKNNAAIADALQLGDRAVEKHINAVFTKLGLSEEVAVHRRVMAVLVYLADQHKRGQVDAMSDEIVRVLIVDDQLPFREAAKVVFDLLDRFEVVAEATSGEEALELVDATAPRPRGHGHQPPGHERRRRHTPSVIADHPGTVVLLVSTYDVNALPRGAAACGALAYVHKEHLDADLIEQLWDERTSAPFHTA